MALPTGRRLLPSLITLASLAALAAVAAISSAASEAEPNDDYLHATIVSAGAEVFGSSTSNDLDWFSVPISGPGLVEVGLKGGAPSPGFYNASLGLIPAKRLESWMEPIVYTFAVRNATTLFIQLTPFTVSNYSFTVSFTPGFAAIQGGGELEFNSLPSDATPLSQGGSFEGLISDRYSADPDWWRMAVPEAGTLLFTTDSPYITYTFHAAADMSVLSRGTSWAQNGDASFGLKLPGAGDVLVEVKASYGARYSIQWDFSPGVSRFQGPDEVESNDVSSAATPVALNATVRGYAPTAFGDTDYWSFDVPERGLVVVRLQGAGYAPEVLGMPGETPVIGTTAYRSSSDLEFAFSNETGPFVAKVGPWSAWSDYNLTVLLFPDNTAFEGPNETEPNNDPSSATVGPVNTPLVGRISSLAGDLDSWSFTIPAAGLVEIRIPGCCNPGYYGYLDYPLRLSAQRAPDGREVYLGAGRACPTCELFYGTMATEPMVLWLTISPIGPYFGDYTLTVNYSSDFSPVQGADEVEPNNFASLATPLSVDHAVAGRLNQAYIDGDTWRLDAAADGYAGLSVWGPPGSYMSMSATDEDGNSVLQWTSVLAGQRPVLFPVSAFRSYSITVGGDGPYTLNVSLRPTMSAYSAGPGEHEPNDAVETAQSLPLNESIRGTMVYGWDSTDFFTMQVAAGDFVSVHFTPLDYSYYPATIYVFAPSQTTFPGAALGGSWAFDAVLFARDSSSVVIQVSAGSYGGDYELMVTVSPTPFLEDGVLSLSEAASDARFGFEIQPFSSPAVPSWAIGTGDGRIFGRSLCLRHGLSQTLGPFPVAAGQLFEPVGSGRRMVAANSDTLEVEAGMSECFHALALDEFQMAYEGGAARAGEMVTGDALTIVTRLDFQGAWGLTGLLALWAVTSNVTLSDLTRWEVSRGDVIAANELLAATTLSQRLPVPPEPPTRPPPALNGTGVTPSGPTPGGAASAAGMGALIGGAVAAVSATVYVMAGGKRFGRPKLRSAPPGGGNPPPWPGAADGLPPQPGDLPPQPGELPPQPGSLPPLPAALPFGQAPALPPATPRAGPGCNSCGAPARPGWRMCTNCGAAIRWN